MNIELRPVTRDNFRDVLKLRVAESQKEFVAPNAYSVAQCYACHECTPFAIYADDALAGFCLYALDTDDDAYWIYRLMVDEGQQRRGIGREAMRQLIARVAALHPAKPVLYISFEPENTVAKALYESLGFVPDGRVEYGEVVYRLNL